MRLPVLTEEEMNQRQQELAARIAGHAPLLLDMATATIALGRIRQAGPNGTPLPENAAATEDGTPPPTPRRR